MSGIFYNPKANRLHHVMGDPHPGWRLVTHDLSAGVNRCRRIMKEWLPVGQLMLVDWDEGDSELRSA